MKSVFKIALALVTAVNVVPFESQAKVLLSAPSVDFQKISEGTESARCVAILMTEETSRQDTSLRIIRAKDWHKNQAITLLKENALPVFSGFAAAELDFYTNEASDSSQGFQRWLLKVENCINSSTLTAEPR